MTTSTKIISQVIGVLLILIGNVYAANPHVKPAEGQQPIAITTQQSETTAQSAIIDINTADENALAGLKGLGPKKANAIVKYRQEHGPFTSFDDLNNVKGFGKNTVATLLKQNQGRIQLSPKS